ncbi:MAG: hypothetical protein HWN67_08650 [Candidatus Helarchaeota archaeon]|nr:hypothetical protein [Candidatus Helarchaeota archaeon]
MSYKNLKVYLILLVLSFSCSKNPASISDQKGFRSIILKEIGGIAGLNNFLNIDWNGNVTFKDTNDSTYTKIIPQEKLDEIVSAIYDNNFLSFKNQYGSPGAVTDQLTTEVIYSDFYFTKSVRVYTDPKDEPPDGFQNIVSILQQIQQDVKKSS